MDLWVDRGFRVGASQGYAQVSYCVKEDHTAQELNIILEHPTPGLPTQGGFSEAHLSS